MRTCLYVTSGFLGDILFGSSVAKRQKEEGQFQVVSYYVGFPQVVPLLKRNPWIDDVTIANVPSPFPIPPSGFFNAYDVVLKQPIHTFDIQPALQDQIAAGARKPNADFKVYTVPEYDETWELRFKSVRAAGYKVLAVLSNWKEKSFLFTEEEYKRGIDVPYKGYGGSNRKIEWILEQLGKDFALVEVGVPLNVYQTMGRENEFAEQASFIKQCDYFIGAEGGLANVAYGVGTKTILTSDFVHQLYGWNGVVRKVKDLKLGPRFYGKPGHIDLDPYLTDEQVVAEIRRIVNG